MVAAGRELGEHLVHRQPPEHLGRGEVLIARERELVEPSALLTLGRRTGTRRPPEVTEPSSWP